MNWYNLTTKWPILCQLNQSCFNWTNPLPIKKMFFFFRGPSLYSTGFISRKVNRSFPFIKGKQPINRLRDEMIQFDYKMTNPVPIEPILCQLTIPLPIECFFRGLSLYSTGFIWRKVNRLFPFIKGKQPINGPRDDLIQYVCKLTDPVPIEPMN